MNGIFNNNNAGNNATTPCSSGVVNNNIYINNNNSANIRNDKNINNFLQQMPQGINYAVNFPNPMLNVPAAAVSTSNMAQHGWLLQQPLPQNYALNNFAPHNLASNSGEEMSPEEWFSHVYLSYLWKMQRQQASLYAPGLPYTLLPNPLVQFIQQSQPQPTTMQYVNRDVPTTSRNDSVNGQVSERIKLRNTKGRFFAKTLPDSQDDEFYCRFRNSLAYGDAHPLNQAIARAIIRRYEKGKRYSNPNLAHRRTSMTPRKRSKRALHGSTEPRNGVLKRRNNRNLSAENMEARTTLSDRILKKEFLNEKNAKVNDDDKIKKENKDLLDPISVSNEHTISNDKSMPHRVTTKLNEAQHTIRPKSSVTEASLATSMDFNYYIVENELRIPLITYKHHEEKLLSKHLTGRTNGNDFSESWRQKFSHHPSWCDADMCLQQIDAGNAHGNRIALYSRAFFQNALYRLGDFVQRWPKMVIFVALLCLSVCLIGLKDVQIETDLVKLWVEQGGRLDEELAFFGEARARYYKKQQENHHHDVHARSRRADSVNNNITQQVKPETIRRAPPVEIPNDTGLSGGFQVVIQTPEEEGANVLTREALLRHVQVLEEIARYEVEMFGETWGLADICFKPPAPKVPKNNLLASYQFIFDKLIPCIWITPADCFWDASKILGPYPPINLSGTEALLPHMPRGNLSWRTLDPQLLIEDLATYKELIGGINEILASLFDRAGVGHAYQDRYCIDPLDLECPKTAPNYFDRCGAYKRFLKWNEKRTAAQRIKLAAELPPKKSVVGNDLNIDLSQFLGRKRRDTATENSKIASITPIVGNMGKNGKVANNTDDYYNDDQVEDIKANTEAPQAIAAKKFNEECEIYARSFLEWMQAVGPHQWEFLDESITDEENSEEVLPPQYPLYGNMLTNGCQGFGRNIMNWPEDLIVGGIQRENGIITHAEAFQSVFLVAAAGDVFQRFKNKDANVKANLDTASFTVHHAGAIIQKWQRSFTERLYAHPLNDNAARERIRVETREKAHAKFGTAAVARTPAIEGITTNGEEGQLVRAANGETQIRVIHPLASTSIQDMLKEFSKFQFGVIFMGYLLMVLYAGFTQFDWDGWWFSVRSNCCLAVIGVFIITYASIAGLGLSAILGIHFNAATTQIVPFLTLGLGIDDLFLFLHNYGGVLESVRKREVAILVKETGMSIFITSSNNILAFVAGTILPIPALRSFCAQTAILLFFNLVSIVIVFPAFVTLDLRRRKMGVRDMVCGCCWAVSALDIQEAKNENSSRNKLAKEPSVDSMAGVDETVAYGQPLSSSYQREMNTYPLSATGDAHARKQREAQLGSADVAAMAHRKKPLYTLEGFLHRFYIPTLMKPGVKFAICFISVCMFMFGCLGLRDSVLGLELADVLPESTPPAAFLRAREKYFSFYPIFIVIKEGVDYPHQQDTIEQLRLDIGKSSFVIKGDTILRHVQEPSEHYWIWFMRVYLKSLQASLDAALNAGQIDVSTGKIINGTLKDEAAIARRLLCSQGMRFDCTNRMKLRLVDENGVIIPDSFYNCLTVWYTLDNMMYYVSQAQIFPPPHAWAFSKAEDGLIPPAENISYSQIPFYLTGLTDTPVIVKMIEEVRGICERYSEFEGLPVFPTGIPFTFWEQYLSLTSYLFAAIIIIGVTVLFIISVIIFNPWAAAMVAVVVVSMTVELGGFMGLFGVKMNPISAVTLITAVGIGVEFTAHVVLAFLTSLGTKNERMASCLEHMFVPVVHGVLSTLLGIVMLAFSEFDFVVKYFFVVMTVLILIGMFNGLAMLPVMLSLVGPPCEVYPTDGSRTLAVPTSTWPPKGGKKVKGSYAMDSERSSNGAVSFDVAPKKISPPPAFDSANDAKSRDSYVYHDSLSTVDEEDSNRSSVQTNGRSSTPGRPKSAPENAAENNFADNKKSTNRYSATPPQSNNTADRAAAGDAATTAPSTELNYLRM